MSRFCTKCGAPGPGEGDFCPRCGARLPAPSDDPPSHPEDEERQRLVVEAQSLLETHGHDWTEEHETQYRGLMDRIQAMDRTRTAAEAAALAAASPPSSAVTRTRRPVTVLVALLAVIAAVGVAAFLLLDGGREQGPTDTGPNASSCDKAIRGHWKSETSEVWISADQITFRDHEGLDAASYVIEYSERFPESGRLSSCNVLIRADFGGETFEWDDGYLDYRNPLPIEMEVHGKWSGDDSELAVIFDTVTSEFQVGRVYFVYDDADETP